VGTNPEFLREGQAIEDFLDPDRLVLGGIDDRTHDVLEELYAAFADAEMMRTSPSTAEMIKYTANSLLATLISFSNEIASLATEVGVDAREVMHGVHLDRRLTPIQADGSRIWPGIISYLEPGCGFGGSCLPKDVRSLAAFGKAHEMPMRILESVTKVNDRQPARMLDLLQRHIPDLDGRRVTVLGLSFKPGTDDVRESPALRIVPLLSEMGAIVTVYDPVAHAEAAKALEEDVIYAGAVGDAVAGADALLLMTSWEEFLEVPKIVRALSPQPVVIDGRGLLDAEGLDSYEDIGR
jgi:UDPglucose 6-dehydrogenase/GDP-mannose 6-dehydrogenase